MKEFIKPFIPKRWVAAVRERAILKKHQQVAAIWRPFIKRYFEDSSEKYELRPKKNLDHSKIIWQYWGQGTDKEILPEIIQICFASVEQHKGGYEVIRLTDETVHEYLDLPEFVWEKRKNAAFSKTFFSDLLRLALLKTYGGVWLDATILLTGELPGEYEALDYFMYQRSDEEEHKAYWKSVYAYYFGWHPRFKVRVLNSVIFSKRENLVISALLNILLDFWKRQHHIPDYFFFQVLYHELLHGELSASRCPVVNDCIPHLLQTKINGSFDVVAYEEVLGLTNIHKMAYFKEAALSKLKNFLANL